LSARPASSGLEFLTAPLIEAGLIGEMLVRDLSLLWRAIMALTIGYSAFISEVFRAGILSVDAGQIEAAKALGLTRAALPLHRAAAGDPHHPAAAGQ
jgi:polar amino acid transport system permease protein